MANIETLAAAVAPLALTTVSGGVSVTVNTVKVTLKDRGNFKVYFKGKDADAKVSALIAANPTLAATRLSGGVVKFMGASEANYPDFIASVRAITDGAKVAAAPVAEEKPVAVAAPEKAAELPAPEKAKAVAAIGSKAAKRLPKKA